MIYTAKNYSCLLLCVVSLYFYSCSKKETPAMKSNNPCDGFQSPYAFNDGPVMTGQTLQLTAQTNEQDVTFEWTGPNNYISDKQNPVVNSIAFDAGGNYFVRIKNAACTSNTQATYVVITAPCTLVNNTFSYGATVWNFYSAITCNAGSSGNYLIRGSSINGDLEIKFGTNIRPEDNKIYGVDISSNTIFDSTKVQLSLFPASGDILRGQSGNVYISNYGNLSAAFCNIFFKSATTANNLTGNTEITCQ
jgi:hypothetical protein